MNAQNPILLISLPRRETVTDSLYRQLNATTMLWTMAGLALAGCGGGGGGGSSRPAVSRTGVVYDGPIEGAEVYIDTDANGARSEADIFIGTTDENGQFAGTITAEQAAAHADKPLLAVLDGAMDLGELGVSGDETTVAGIWRAPPGSMVISPLTELMIEAGDEAPLLFRELGIPESVDVTSYNPFAPQLSADSSNADIRRAATEVATLLADDVENLVATLKTRLDDAPGAMNLSAARLSLAEGVTVAVKLADITFTDDGLGDNTARVDDTARFEMRDGASGAELWLKAGVALDHESATSHAVTVTPDVTGTGTPPTSRTFTVHVIDTNDEAPQITSPSSAPPLPENTEVAAGETVYMATGTYDTTVITWSLAGTDDDSLFAIDGATGVVTFKAAVTPDYETKAEYSFTLRATSGSLSTEQEVRIVITDADEAGPVFTGAPYAFDLAENADGSVAVGAVTASDADGTSNEVSYRLINAAGEAVLKVGDFTLDGATGALRYTGTGEDFETAPQSYSLKVEASSGPAGAKQTAAASITVTVTNLPFDIALSSTSLTMAERTTASEVKLADIVITGDQTPGELQGFTTDSRFEVRKDANGGYALWLKAGQILDYETDNGAEVTITLQGESDGQTVLKTARYFLGIENARETADLNDDKHETDLNLGGSSDDPRIKWIIDDSYYWTGTRGKGVEIAYSFIDPANTASLLGVNTPDRLFAASDAVKQEVRDSLALFERVSLLTFVEVADSKTTTMRFGISEDDDTKVAFAWFPAGGFDAGNVWLNGDGARFNQAENLYDGSYETTTIIHEIGHALGFTHSQDTYGGRDVRLLGHEHNTRSYTLMAYAEAWNDTINEGIANDTHGPTTLMMNDIAAVQYVYGVNETWAREDTIYALYERSVLHETIWDTGGEDTISWQGQATSARINLHEGEFSSFGEITGPESPLLNIRGGFPEGSRLVGIALGTVIENATGGLGNDTLIGNAVANDLTGGPGHDVASYRLSDAAVTVSLGGPIDADGYVTGHEGGDAVGDRFKEIEGIEGSGFADTLTGDAGDNTLEGGGGGDTLIGGAGHDVATYRLSAAAVTVSLAGPKDADGFVTGHTGGDAAGDRLKEIEGIEGSGYADTLTGDAGDNTLEGGGGGDTLIGGAGHDLASYRGSYDGVTVSLAGPLDADGFITGHEGGDAAGDRFKEIEGIKGSAYADTLTGDAGDNTLEGGEGDDLLEGGAGADTIDGGDGFDYARYLNSSAGVTVSLAGPKDADGYVTGHSGGDAAGDRLKGIERILGSDFADRLTGDDGVNRFNGGDGADVIDGGDGDDMSIYWFSPTAVTVDLAGPKDANGFTIITSQGEADGDRLKSIENLAGSPHGDTLSGDAGDNVINGDDGGDLIDGRAGTDAASYVFSYSGVSIRLGEIDQDGYASNNEGGFATGDRLRGIENLYGSDYGDTLTGTDGVNTFWANDGNDLLEGFGGSDMLDGGAGYDTASYTQSAAGVTVNLGGVKDADGYVIGHTGGDAAGDRLKSIERIWGSDFADILTGDEEDNSIWGNDGVDVIKGGTGDDWLNGGDGGDTIEGGAGDDVANYYESAAGVTVDLGGAKDADGYVTGHTGGDAAGDKLLSIEEIYGSIHADTLTGDGGENRIWGDDGDDVIKGGGGDDWLNGGDGGDTIEGGGGADVANYYESAAGVTVDLGVAKDADGYVTGHTGGDAAGDRLKGIEDIYGSTYADTLTGDGGENWIWGDDGDDVITGGDDDDRLYGGEGRNIFTGGSGYDNFALTNIVSGIGLADVITDFSTAENDGLSFLAEVSMIWLKRSLSVLTGEQTNDADTFDTVIYADAAQTQIIAVLEDFTSDLDGHIGDTTITLTIV